MNSSDNFQSLKKEADDFRKNKNYSSAQSLYKKLWEEYREQCNEWEGWGYAYCLKQAKEYKLGLNICREIYKIKPDFKHNNSVYSWCIYHTEVKKKQNNEEDLLKAGGAILKLCEQDDKYSPYTKTVFEILKFLKKKAIYPYDQILSWLEKVDCNKLSFESPKYPDQNNKLIKKASEKENYYSYKSKALLQKKDYKKCISCSEEGLDLLQNKGFHYDNDIWFKRNIALSYDKLGEKEKSLKILLEILPHKAEWYIYKDIADIYYYQDDWDKALQYAINGVRLFGDDDKKINLYFLIAQILDKKQKNNEAKKHFEFVCQLKKWEIKDKDKELKSFINQYNLKLDNSIGLKENKKKLKKIWESFKNRKNGTITNILPNGRAGFLEDNNSKEPRYFKINTPKSWHQKGIKVTFEEIEGYDRKKKQNVTNATNVKIAKD